MGLVLELRDYARYPFLKESQQFIAQHEDSLEGFLQTNTGKIALTRGVETRALRDTGETFPRRPVKGTRHLRTVLV